MHSKPGRPEYYNKTVLDKEKIDFRKFRHQLGYKGDEELSNGPF